MNLVEVALSVDLAGSGLLSIPSRSPSFDKGIAKLLTRGLCSLLSALVLTGLPGWSGISYAHAVIARSEPVGNAQLAKSPAEIRIWFTEPLEPMFSGIELRDSTGAIVATSPSFVDPADNHQLVLIPGELSDGLYTVVWGNVSSADGHRQKGSFPILIGAAGVAMPAATVGPIELAPWDVFSRWVNFWAFALSVGSIAFLAFVWQPTARELSEQSRVAPRPLWFVVWAGWVASGISGVLFLVNQVAVLLAVPLTHVPEFSKVSDVIYNSRFGTLWLERMGLWIVMGALLMAARRSSKFAWLATLCGLLMLLPASLYSHASVSNDVGLSVFSDWVHLVMATLWVGGLVQLVVAIPLMVSFSPPIAPKVGHLIAHFSNYARIAVVGLIVTGLYAAWYQVGSLEALISTFYGQLLAIKLLLAFLLVVIAGVNLLWTYRRLRAGQIVWVGRLRGLVSIEVLLALSVLLVVGAMTSVNPARNDLAQKQAAAEHLSPEAKPITITQAVDDLHILLVASPGFVGPNTFTVQLADDEGHPVTIASLIRMRFEHQTENLGESELQIQPQEPSPDGTYFVEGANLSTLGDWRIRMTIQRPDQFDSVIDFTFPVTALPTDPPAPVSTANSVPAYRTPVLMDVGGAAFLAGLYFFTRQRLRLKQGEGLLASLLVILGTAFLLTAFLT